MIQKWKKSKLDAHVADVDFAPIFEVLESDPNSEVCLIYKHVHDFVNINIGLDFLIPKYVWNSFETT